MSLASNAAFYRKVNNLLDSWGWPVDRVANADTRTNSTVTMTPTQMTHHHTGSASTATSYLLNPADRPQLRVLANYHITRSHRIKFLAAGGASHGGYTDQAVYNKVAAGNAPLDRDMVPGADSKSFSVNKRTVGVETDGAGGSAEWDLWMYGANVALAAACHVAGGWASLPSPKVAAHKEHTRRKPGDPYAPMGRFRGDVLVFLADPKRPDGTSVNAAAPQVQRPVVTASGKLVVDGEFGDGSWAVLDQVNRTKYKAVAGPNRAARLQRVLNVKAAAKKWTRRLVVDGQLGADTYSMWAAVLGINPAPWPAITSLTDELAQRTQTALNDGAW